MVCLKLTPTCEAISRAADARWQARVDVWGKGWRKGPLRTELALLLWACGGLLMENGHPPRQP